MQTPLHHHRRGDIHTAGRHAEAQRRVAEAIGVFDLDGIKRERSELIDVVKRQFLKGTAEDRRQLTCETVMPPQVGTVGERLIVDLDERIGLGNQIRKRGTRGNIGRELEEDLVPGRKSQLSGAAEDSLARMAGHSGRLNFFIPQRGSGRREDNRLSERGVRSAADGRIGSVPAVDHTARERLFTGSDLFGLDNFADQRSVDETVNRLKPFHFRRCHSEAIGNHRGIKPAEVNKIGNPIE